MFALSVLLLCYCFIFCLLRLDMKWRKAGSRALLIPAVWLAIQGSRPVSYWVGGGGGDLEASPINTLTFAVLILAALLVLFKRRIDWGAFLQRNKSLCLIYLFLALSALWSEMPLISLKRIIKDFGCVPVALVFLTELDPLTAIRTVFVRVSYVLFPLSVVFIKYFPEIGRQASRSGENMFTGVTTQKNSLGETVFVFGLMLIWDLVETRRREKTKARKRHTIVLIGMLMIGIWLLNICDSKTSLVCFVVGGLMFWLTGRLVRMRNGKQILVTGLLVAFSFWTLDNTFGLSDKLADALGRNPTLTGRTNIWRIVLEQKTDPWIGEGFYIFWDTEKGGAVVDQLARIQSAHNGYLETYVDAGIIGVTLLGLLILAAGSRVINRLFTGSPLGRMGIMFWTAALVYNLSESSFFRLDVLWFTFLLGMIEIPNLASKVPGASLPIPEFRQINERLPVEV